MDEKELDFLERKVKSEKGESDYEQILEKICF